MTALDFSEYERILPDSDWKDQEWRIAALCDGADPDIFFPVVPDDATLAVVRRAIRYRRVEEAKEICFRCPVQGHCLTFALNTRQPIGIWGGLTPAERGVGAAAGGSARKNQKNIDTRRAVIRVLGLEKALARFM